MKKFLIVFIIASCALNIYLAFYKTNKIQANYDLMNELTILTSSFDNYSELWQPHYHFLFKYWPELNNRYKNIPVKLISNQLDFNHPRVESLKIGADTTWSANMLKALDKVDTKYVLILLDDYIINDYVNQARLVEFLSLLEHSNGAYIEIFHDDRMFTYNFEPNYKLVNLVDDVIIRSKRKSHFINSLQACIWDKEKLIELLDSKESAWDFENQGNKRARKSPYPFYMVTKNPAFKYLNAVAKRAYEADVVEFINNNGLEFEPKKLPVKSFEEMKEHLKSNEANKLLKKYGGNN